MQVTETLSEGLKRGFTVTVPAAELEAKRDARLKEVAGNLNLPGFRPGKVPVSLARQRYGDAIWGEVLEQAVSDAIRTVFEERGLRPAGQPKVDLVSGQEDKGADLEFKVESEILPEIAVPDLSDLALTRLKTPVSDEAINKVLEDIAKRGRTFEVIEEVRPAGKGDVVAIDFVGKQDGVAFDGGTAQDVNVEIGGEGFIPGFAEQIEGMKPGEEKVITVTFPADYGAEELAGKEATFDIKVNQLKKAVDAPVDEELAKNMGFESLNSSRIWCASRSKANTTRCPACVSSVTCSTSFPARQILLPLKVWWKPSSSRSGIGWKPTARLVSLMTKIKTRTKTPFALTTAKLRNVACGWVCSLLKSAARTVFPSVRKNLGGLCGRKPCATPVRKKRSLNSFRRIRRPLNPCADRFLKTRLSIT